MNTGYLILFKYRLPLIFASRWGGEEENWIKEKLALENKGEGRGERNFEGTN